LTLDWAPSNSSKSSPITCAKTPLDVSGHIGKSFDQEVEDHLQIGFAPGINLIRERHLTRLTRRVDNLPDARAL